MIDAERFLTSSISKSSIGQAVCRTLAAAINAVEPYAAVKRHLTRAGNLLTIDQEVINLDLFKHVFVVGAGKASVPMAVAVCEVLSTNFSRGIIITKDGHGIVQNDQSLPLELQIIEASHPIPDLRGITGTRKIIELLKTKEDNDLIIFLLSGGGSALLTEPADNVSLDDLQQTTTAMLACGATIQEINCIRKHLDLVKGGQLARLAAPSRMISLILSDVIGDPLDIIASGPTVPDPSTYRDALEIVKKYKLIKLVPAPVISHLERGASGILPETPKVNDPAFNNAHNLIIGNNRKAAEAAVQHGRNEGFHVLLLTNYLQGEAYQVGRIIASIALQLGLTKEPIPRPACIVLGGETTVTLTGRGLGGRNQELALGCVEMLAGLKQVLVISLASDGGDGPTDAAGAVVTGETYDTAIKKGMQPAKFQIENDSYNFFNQLSDLIKTGPTQTNVNDLIFIFAY